MKDQKIPYINLGGAAAFGILTLWRLLTMATTFFDWVGYWGFFQTVFTLVLPAIPRIAFYALMAYTFFVNWRNPIPIYGICAIALFSLLSGLINMARAVFAFDFGYWFSTLPGFLHGIGMCALALIGVVLRTKWLPQLRQYARQLWFIPSAILAAYTLLYFITVREYISFGSVLNSLLLLAGMALVNLWLVAPARDLGSLMPLLNKGVSAVSSAASSGNSGTAPQTGGASPAAGAVNTAAPGEGFVSMAMHVLLLFLSCGIWLYIWIYRTTKFTNNVPGKDPRSPGAQLLLCMFVPLYIIFWTYETAKRVDQMSAYRGISSDLATLCLILAIFLPIVPPIMLQSKINTLAQPAAPIVRPPVSLPEQPKAPEAPKPPQPEAPKPEAPVSQPAAPEAPAPQQPAVPKLTPAGVQELRMYKDLLDSGIITQEEFIEHRRRILGK